MGDGISFEQITLVNLTGDAEAEWMRAFKEAADQATIHTVPGLSDLQFLLEENERSYAVVAYPAPMEEVARSLAGGLPPCDALTKWQENADSLIRLYRRFWQRMTVVEGAGIPRRVDELFSHIQERTALKLKPPERSSESTLTGETGISPNAASFRLGASQMLSTPRARSLAEELTAISAASAETLAPSDVVESFLSHRQMVDSTLQTATAKNEELADTVRKLQDTLRENRSQLELHARNLESVNQENAMLLSQLHKTQEELERYLVRQQAMSAKLESLRRGRTYRKKKIAELERTAREREEKIEWLRSVRDQHRHTARELRTETKERNKRLEERDQRLAWAQKKIDAIQNSRSWRYTRFLRKQNGTDK